MLVGPSSFVQQSRFSPVALYIQREELPDVTAISSPLGDREAESLAFRPRSSLSTLVTLVGRGHGVEVGKGKGVGEDTGLGVVTGARPAASQPLKISKSATTLASALSDGILILPSGYSSQELGVQ